MNIQLFNKQKIRVQNKTQFYLFLLYALSFNSEVLYSHVLYYIYMSYKLNDNIKWKIGLEAL